MANYTSNHTGAQIDLSVGSGSTTSGVIKDFTTLSGSSSSTIQIGSSFTGNSVNASSISASSAITSSKLLSYDDIELRDGNPGGDTLVKIYDSSDDGIIDVYQNNTVKNRIHGNGASFFKGGSVSASAGLTASAFVSYDDIRLLDGVHTGDTLVRIYDSSDDGVIDVYKNNDVKTRIHGNGTSFFNGGNVAIGMDSGGTNANEKLTVIGNISASGNITGSKINSIDEIILNDGNAGDTLVRAYASSDDGVIDVYQNNVVKNRIHGNDISFFNNNAVGIGTTTPDSDLEINPISGSGVASLQTASLHVSGALSNVRFQNLPTVKPTVTGSLWLSGSAGQSSKYLVVFTGW